MVKLCLSAAALLLSSTVAADAIDPLLGTWVSPDGFAKQQFKRSFDGSLIQTSMWFNDERGWKLVARGAMFQRPGEPTWRGVSRTRDMDDIELFESTVELLAPGYYRLVNIAFENDAEIVRTEEDWVFENADRYEYTVYKTAGESRQPWMRGTWQRDRKPN